MVDVVVAYTRGWIAIWVPQLALAVGIDPQGSGAVYPEGVAIPPEARRLFWSQGAAMLARRVYLVCISNPTRRGVATALEGHLRWLRQQGSVNHEVQTGVRLDSLVVGSREICVCPPYVFCPPSRPGAQTFCNPGESDGGRGRQGTDKPRERPQISV